MALTSDGMESKTRHGELANGHSQFVDYEGMAKHPSGYVLWERLWGRTPKHLD